jgi:protein CWC15
VSLVQIVSILTRVLNGSSDDDEEEDDDDDDSDDDEDETAQLLAELEKIKRERAAEEERKAREISEGKARDREEDIAMGNPLLNLEAALGGQGQRSSGKPGTFAVKKRWDDGERVTNLSKLAGP